MPKKRGWERFGRTSFHPICGTLPCLKRRHRPREDSESFGLGRFLAPLQQQLHAEADAEKGAVGGQPLPQEGKQSPSAQLFGGSAESAHAGKNQSIHLSPFLGRRDDNAFCFEKIEGFLDRLQVPGAVIDDADHDSIIPLVLGMAPPARGSRSHAIFIALPQALKIASILW